MSETTIVKVYPEGVSTGIRNASGEILRTGDEVSIKQLEKLLIKRLGALTFREKIVVKICKRFFKEKRERRGEK